MNYRKNGRQGELGMKFLGINTFFMIWFLSSNAIANDEADFGHYRKLLLSGQFSALEKEQHRINEGYVSGRVTWSEFYPAFDTLWFSRDIEGGLIEANLNKWRRQQPSSAYALLNSGNYYYARGFEKRGGKWVSETPGKNIDNMWRDFSVASDYLTKALKMKPNLIQGYRTLINIKNHSSGVGHTEQIKTIVNISIQYKKNDYVLWHAFLHTQKPRWGGSYEAMTQTLKDIKDSFPNDDINYSMLTGMVATDMADLLIRDKRYEQASDIIGKYEETKYPLLYLEKAQLSKKKKDYQQCVDAASYVLTYYPYDTNALKSMGSCSDKLENWAEAKDAYYKYSMIKGRGAWQLYYLGKSYMHLREYDKAYALFKASEVLKPKYKKYTKKYVSYIEREFPNMTHTTLDELGL